MDSAFRAAGNVILFADADADFLLLLCCERPGGDLKKWAPPLLAAELPGTDLCKEIMLRDIELSVKSGSSCLFDSRDS